MENKNIERYLEILNKDGFSKWDFVPDENGPMVQSGYEDVYDELEKYTYERYMADVPEGHSGFEADDTPNQRKLQREIIDIYRSKNIFPINYYTHNGILNEIKKCIAYDAHFDGDTVSCGAGVGTGLCNFLFPNLYDTVSAKDLKKVDGEYARKKFYEDDFLKKAIRIAIQYGKSTPQPSSIYSGIGLCGSLPSNFRPMNAKAIWNRFTEPGDTVLDFACVDDETEFFNGKVWKSIADYKDGEKVLQYNEDGTAELVDPLKYINYKSDDPFYLYEGARINSALTGNHKVVYKNRVKDTKELEEGLNFTTMENVVSSDFRGRIPLNFNYNGDYKLSKGIIKLLVMIQADGSIMTDGSKNRVRFGLHKKSKIERLFQILEMKDVKPLILDIHQREEITTYKGVPYNNTIVHFTFKDLNKFFDKEKTFPDSFLHFNEASKVVFLNELSFWDGYEIKERARKIGIFKEGIKPTEYSTNNKRNAEIVQFLYESIGVTSSLKKDKRNKNINYTVYCQSKAGDYSSYDNKSNLSILKKEDKYCFTVPSGMLVLRRENKVFITGNCGFGGRLLGALSSKKNLKYIGCDPNTETQSHLKELGDYIEEVTGRKNSFELHVCGSEDLEIPDNTVDFAFASPPYFDLELYSTEETQSSIKFPTLESWLEGYVRGTIKMLYKALKPKKFYAVNIADFTSPSGGICHFVDEWSRISEEEGFERMPNLYLGIPARAGSMEKENGEMKKEVILVFKSKKSRFKKK